MSQIKCMNNLMCYQLLEICTMPLKTLYSFWKNLSGHFSRFVCNHIYGYAFRRIEKTDSLRLPQNSVFPRNLCVGKPL